MDTRFLLSLTSIPIALAIAACDQGPRGPVHDITIARIITGGPPERPHPPARPLEASTLEQPVTSGAHDRERAVEPPPPVKLLPLDTWRERWPDAARDLDAWAAHYPGAAETLFAWDAVDDERAEALIEWAIGNRYEQFDAFLLTRHGWGANEVRMRDTRERPAMHELLDVFRNNAQAWIEIAHHPYALSWLGSHRPPARVEAAHAKSR